MKVLWLASWYPNKFEPVNGDFVQRHAQAVAKFLPITVIHVVQAGMHTAKEFSVTENINGNLKELVYTFPFKRTGLELIDKIRYNIAYQKFYLDIVDTYIQQNGLPDLIHVHVPMKAGLIALQLKKKYKIPFIVSEQASYYEDAAPDTFKKRSWFFQKNTEKIFQSANLVTNVSATIGIKIQQMFQLANVVPVHNVVDVAVFYPKQKNPNPIFQWVHVSTLGEQKNIEGLLRAFQILKQKGHTNWHLTLAGPLYKQHEPTVLHLGLSEYITFTGELKHNDVSTAMQNADAFVLFSKHENFPCVIPEALCCGLPVVASNVGGVAEAIDESNGIVVPSENIEALANALIDLMDKYHLFSIHEIAANAKSKYSEAVIGNQFIQLYKQLKGVN